jgi:chemotaxis protein CheZ
VVDKIQKQVKDVNPLWSKLMQNELSMDEFKALCIDIDALLTTTNVETDQMKTLMTDVLMAQDFQDLTGQVIRKVIDLVVEVEEGLINMLTAFGITSNVDADKSLPKVGDNLVEGPIVNTKERTDVVEDQDDVDDLLSSLGF